MKRIATLICVAAALTASSTFAQDKTATDFAAFRAAIKADKRAYVASTLALTDGEAKQFWPLYDAYQRDLERSNRRRSAALVEAAGSPNPISARYAANIAKELREAEDDEQRARAKIRDRVTKVLPPRKAVRYLQIEWKIRAAENNDIAMTVPLLAP